MKLSLLLMGVLVLGCAKSVPPPKPVVKAEAPIHRATVQDCGDVYGRLLSIALIEHLEPDELFSKEAVEAGAVLLDQYYIKTGKKQLFFSYCLSQLNTQQTHCMVESPSLDGMDVCDAKFADKTKKSP